MLSGAGLSTTSQLIALGGTGTLSVNVDDSTIEINGVDNLQIKDFGITNSKIANETIDLTEKVTGVLPVANGGTGSSSLNNLITLGTHTTGNYIATIADSGSSHITVNNSGSETAAVTLSISENAVGLTEMAGITRGNLIVGDANGDPSYLSLGAQNRVLTSNGTNPSWTQV